MDMALQDIKVLDLTHGIAGPYCTKMLADYGADVLKVEKPSSGDFARRLGPFPSDIPDMEKSGLFLLLNTNKRGITLNLKSDQAKDIVLELVKTVDVVVENFSPYFMPSVGLSYETLSEVNPKLILVSISNFGQTGPYRDYKADDMITYAMGGAMHSKGLPGREPMKYGTHVTLYQSGIVGSLATMTALFSRERNGQGEHVDISIFETAAHSRDARSPDVIAAQFINAVKPRRTPGSTMGTGTFPCKDGYIVFSGGGARFSQTVAMIGKPEILEDPRFSTRSAQLNPENIIAFNQGVLMPWFMQHTMSDAWAKAQEHHIISGPIFNSHDLLSDSHFRNRWVWEDIEHPATGNLEYPGRPFIMEKTPWQIRRPAPLLGQHNSEIYCDLLGYSSLALANMPTQGVI